MTDDRNEPGRAPSGRMRPGRITSLTVGESAPGLAGQEAGYQEVRQKSHARMSATTTTTPMM